MTGKSFFQIKNEKFLFGIFFLFLILFSCFVSATYTTSNVQWSQYNPTVSEDLDESVCKQGQDFLVQISPFGCTPAVVRTDLLEENDVPVYCQLAATKINPLIDVEAIDSISFSGQYPEEVAGIGFHPAKAALGVEGQLNSPVLNNIGYIVILLKKQANASAIPDYVSGNLSAKIKYNVNNAFGIGKALFYLPEMSDKDFENKKSQYTFWSGKGTLRVDSIDTNSAKISLYQNNNKLSSVNLKEGETSDVIYLPGFQCQAGLKLKLNDLENPDTRAKLRVNSEVVEVAENEKFLDNKCRVTDLSDRGLLQQVKIRCSEDDGTTTSTLTISPRIILNIDGEDKTVGIGDYLYDESNERRVYLAYMGTKGSTTSSEDLYAYLISTPTTSSNKLSEEQISSLSVLIGDLIGAGQTSPGIIDSVSDAIKVFAGAANLLARRISRKETIFRIDMDISFEGKAYGKDVSIVGFASAQDPELTGEAKTNYENAKEDYETIRDSYSSEAFTKDASFTFGEEALYQEILLAWSADQKLTVIELCKEFEQDYPNSGKAIEECENAAKLASDEIGDVYVTINGNIKRISFDGIYEPSWEDYSVRVKVISKNGKDQFFDLTKNKIIYLDPVTNNDYLQLISADDGFARVRTNLDTYGLMNSIIKEFGSDIMKLEMNVPRDLGKGYSFTLTEVNLKKVAKVSVIPNIDNAGTSANFSFSVGIEKRAIDLSPERVKDMIEDLDKEIKDWGEVSDSLGKMVEGLKTSCLVTGLALITKNFLLNTGGQGIARQAVMRGENGWTEKCADLVNKGTYSSQEQCYNKNADEIDSDVDELFEIIDKQNSDIKDLEEGITTSEFLGEKVVDTDKFVEKYIPEVEDCIEDLPDTITDPSGKSGSISKSDVLAILSQEGYTKRIFSLDQLREIDLYCRARNNENLQDIANTRLYSNLLDMKTNSNNFAEIVTLAGQLGVSSDDLTFMEVGEKLKKYSYTGLTNAGIGNKITGEGIDSNTPVAVVSTSDGRKFIVALDSSSGTSQFPIKRDSLGTMMIYSSDGVRLSVDQIPADFSKVYFEKIDASSYKNTYKNAELKYYETEPYKGMPAIVPFDLSNGWYAATKQTLGTGSNIQTYESSGRVSSFYLCNVGANGLEENIGGDDICESINTGTGQSYNQFPALSENDAKSLISKSVRAIEQASRLYKSGLSGKVSILGERVDVGEPAVDIPEYQCQDFMSPKDCLLLFNLCDPVICPSSRCDLGGAYPVSNVVQTGVIGSIALCLPNVKEGIIIPVCLTGIKAGIDGFLSIKQSYRDCLQESLDTGAMVGICDEIYSIYICDFFWRQALPLADIAIPKIFEKLLGQDVRGGGEYLGVADAWDNSGKAVDYFVNYYGANAKEAFIARTTEVAKEEVCKSFVSGVVPSNGDLLDQLTEPDSPSQFHGRFDEISLTTVTVPPTSHYKVFYHIYAGQDSGAYYQVYLKGSLESSYYQDTTQNLMVASGYISVGDYATETKDLVATSGYKEMCINVNGQEECGFEEVSTSFAVNYIEDEYLASQATETGITKESDCISGTSSLYSLTDLNIQAAAEEMINPAIYNEGIIRICATANPGLGTDPYAGTENSRWIEVGYCDNKNIKCWLDRDSVENVIKTTTVENQALAEVSQDYVQILKNESGYLTDDEFSSAIDEIEKEEDYYEKIEMINEIVGKVFWSKEKVQLLYLRGNAYGEIFKTLFGRIIESAYAGEPTEIEGYSLGQWGDISARIFKDGDDTGYYVEEKDKDTLIIRKRTSEYEDYTEDAVVGEIYSSGEIRISEQIASDLEELETDYYYDFGSDTLVSTVLGTTLEITDAGQKVLATAKELEEASADKSLIKGELGLTCAIDAVNCWDSVMYVYQKAGVTTDYCVYSDPTGKEYTVMWEKDKKDYEIEMGVSKRDDGQVSFLVYEGVCSVNNEQFSGEELVKQKYENVRPGDILSIVSDPWYGHNVIFIEWVNKNKKIAKVFGWESESVFGYSNIDISETGNHPLYVYWTPKISGSKSTTTSTQTESTTASSIGQKIYQAALEIAESDSYDTSVKFVADSLNNAGVTIPYDYYLETLVNNIKSNNNFAEVNLNANNFEAGDILLIGEECENDRFIGIFRWVSGSKVYFYSNVGDGVELVDISTYPDVEDDLYIYKAYRYVGDLSSSERSTIKANLRTPWTIDSAINEVSTLKGDYDDNQVFADQLVFDGLLSKSECEDMTGAAWFSLQKDMSWLRKLLLEKSASSGQAENVIAD